MAILLSTATIGAGQRRIAMPVAAAPATVTVTRATGSIQE
jgi:hypothetical protein